MPLAAEVDNRGQLAATLRPTPKREHSSTSDWSQASTVTPSRAPRPGRAGFSMRLGTRIQLGLLVLIAVLLGLAAVTIATWYTNYDFVINIRSSRLTLTASLKASQVGSAISLVRTSVQAVTTRLLIQSALQRYNYQGNNTAENWAHSISDLQAALNGGVGLGILLQTKVTCRNDTGSGNNTLTQATGTDLARKIILPWTSPNGSTVFLGDDAYPALSYPPNLYPNLTFSKNYVNSTFSWYSAEYNGYVLNKTQSLLLGPWALNDTFALASLTVPIINNTSANDILAWMTVVVDARLVLEPIIAQEGLDSTGVTLLVGPANTTNMLPPGVLNSSAKATQDLKVHYLIPPNNTLHRHDEAMKDPATFTFDWSSFPVVKEAWTNPLDSTNAASSELSTHNEEGKSVGVGYAQIPAGGLVNWLLLVEQDHSEVYRPITKLRDVLLACVFGTTGFVLLITIPIAHYGTAPIRRLRDATKHSVAPPGYLHDSDRLVLPDGSSEEAVIARKEGFFAAISRWRHGVDDYSSSTKEDRRKRRQFKIPAKVKDRKHCIHDELTDLTKTFNEMSDELMVNYERLEERVQQRTMELEDSKQAAEAANEAKTLFVANISHELKTPLNGILGIAQTSQVETSLAVLKRDMRIIYNQGDLLTKLIQDLLLFSKNQVDHQIVLEEGEFRVRDITTQVFSTFQVHARDGGINLILNYEGPNDGPTLESSGVSEQKEFGPFGTGRVKDMVLWGDKTRLLQVVNNLTSNAMKFTPNGGSVRVVVRCLGDDGSSGLSRRGSMMSKQNSISRASAMKPGSGRNSRALMQHPSNVSEHSSDSPVNKINTAIEINALDRHTPTKERTSSPPLGSRDMWFEWEVQDTGPGMPVDVQEKVFEPFFQGDMALSKKFQGTGLGLSICAQLAKLMGGSMDLKSEEGKGSTFTLRVPLRYIGNRADSTASSVATDRTSIRMNNSPRTSISGELPASDTAALDARSTRSFSMSSRLHEGSVHGKSYAMAETSKAGKASSAGVIGSAQALDPSRSPPDPGPEVRSLKVLVAEDNKTNQLVVARLLKMEKITNVKIAEDGAIAYQNVIDSMAKGDNFDLIFMDVQMPNMDGLEATRLIREAGYKGPIVALSAYSEEANVKGCHEAGMDDFVSKPIQLPRLKLVLKTFCPAEYQ